MKPLLQLRPRIVCYGRTTLKKKPRREQPQGDTVEEGGKIMVILVAKVRVLSPRVVSWNEDDNSFIAVAAIPLDVGFDLADLFL